MRRSLPVDTNQTSTEAELDSDIETWLYRNRLKILICLLISMLALGLGLRLLAPILSNSLANSLPSNWVRSSSERVLATLDAGPLQESMANTEAQALLRTRFASLTAPGEGAPPYRLIFRRSSASAPLLFSLPSGDIVITDRFFSSIPNLTQQLALLCQELGHLQHQHSLREAVRHNLLWLASAAYIGSAESSINALSDGLLRSDYSLQQVLEADRFAQIMLRSNGLPADLLSASISQFGENTAPGRLVQSDDQPAFRQERLKALHAQP